MTEVEIRNAVLTVFYDNRDSSRTVQTDHILAKVDVPETGISRVCEHLKRAGLITWQRVAGHAGHGTITSIGVEHIEKLAAQSAA
jgi:DNA-binding IscR family transcriptional regulator